MLYECCIEFCDSTEGSSRPFWKGAMVMRDRSLFCWFLLLLCVVLLFIYVCFFILIILRITTIIIIIYFFTYMRGWSAIKT